jgi:hypothetical protein
MSKQSRGGSVVGEGPGVGVPVEPSVGEAEDGGWGAVVCGSVGLAVGVPPVRGGGLVVAVGWPAAVMVGCGLLVAAVVTPIETFRDGLVIIDG